MLITVFPGYALVLNNPYPAADAHKKIYYSSFSEQPKTLDPARSYSSNEYAFIAQIYEPLLQYDYYKRPYTLVPLLAANMPVIRYVDAQLRPIISGDTQKVAYSVYAITIKKGILYQPHPALAQSEDGRYRYLNLPAGFLQQHSINELANFEYTGTREVIADDFIYEIKRLASPRVSSSISGLMAEHILGFKEFAAQIQNQPTQQFLDLRQYPLAGVQKRDDYHFDIVIKGVYPQFLFWLAMPFFAPVPWEADAFYAQDEMDDNNLSFDWYPIGTGPFMLSENNPNRRMVLLKNPNFREEYYPVPTSAKDKRFQQRQGQRLPLITEAYYTLEKESIPRWNKFLQGYYDSSAIANENFDQTIQLDEQGKPLLTATMRNQNLRLQRTIDPSIYYLGFNMLDPVVGGTSKRARYLRQALSIAINYDEFISIFFNGRGQAAQGPLPPGIFGYREGKEGINPLVYRWDAVQQRAVRRPLSTAKKLLKAAGYNNGIDPATGKPLILHYDVAITGGPDDKAQLEWMRKQFAQLGIDLNIRATQYNRFQEKMRSGNAQIFYWGWNADYPDPENFLFQLYGANGKVAYGGENAANYHNPKYDALFEQMKNRNNDAKRQQIIDSILTLLRYDAPWIWGVNTETFILTQQWVTPAKPNTISLGQLKYVDLDVACRNYYRALWNQPIFWPVLFFILFLVCTFLPLVRMYKEREKGSVRRMP